MNTPNKARLQHISLQILTASAVLAISLLQPSSKLIAQAPASIPEVIEWTWEVRPQHVDATLPNVLLLGDSITRSYFSQVANDLRPVANVYLMSSSTAVGDPRLPLQIAEFATLENVSFSVVHFNNGMHGWNYTEAQYKAAFPSFLKAVRDLPGHGKLIWATTTPVKTEAPDGATNSRIDARNAVAETLLASESLATDDLHALMSRHRDLYQDSVHFNDAGASLMGDQAADLIKQALRTHAADSPPPRGPVSSSAERKQ